MAVGFPTKVSYANGDVFSASDINDTNGTLNLIKPTAKGDIFVGSAANTYTKVAVGADGLVLKADSTAPTGVAWSSAGATVWTQRLGGTGTSFRQIAYNGSNIWVATGTAGQLYSSADAFTWTSRTSGFGANNIADVSFGNGLFVAVGDNGTITTSTDGTTWTARTSNMGANNIKQAIYANSLWVAVGEGGGTTNTGGIIYSTDGLTWTRKSQSLTVGAGYWSVAWNGTNWVVGADLSTNNYLYASAPSGTWTAGSTGSATGVNLIYWDGTRHITGEGNGSANATWRFSTSTTLGTTTLLNSATSAMTTGNNQYVQLNKYFSNKVYSLTSGRILAFTTQSAAYPIMMQPVDSPIVAYGSGGALWVGTAGYVIADTSGRIYTSF